MTIAAAIDACIRAGRADAAAGRRRRAESLWQRAARVEALRRGMTSRSRSTAPAHGHRRARWPGRYRVVSTGGPRGHAERSGEFGLSLIWATVEHQPRGAACPGAARGELLVALGGRTVPVVVNGRTRRRGRRRGGPCAGCSRSSRPCRGGSSACWSAPATTSPSRQGVVVVEAMKMENELRSPKAGRVKEVHGHAPGRSVEAGRVLVVIE